MSHDGRYRYPYVTYEQGGGLEGAETDSAGVRLGNLDVGELVGRDHHATTLLIVQCHRGGTIFERRVHDRLDLIGRLGALDGQLSRGAFDANPDLHADQAS